ncbi:tat pathway signal sequence [Micractinium conductrix]|uniref:Tat pathway signal sequence n=1 Tax=Micractinium conductrix TaxID=554055 RepID=A0A2P6V6B1_9CHLO|nr:tat pathway signal sequence [Micractinium conductrix]|eukprot:PSC69626.1 tat pathway signal sequence [Micractinium conductrix]
MKLMPIGRRRQGAAGLEVAGSSGAELLLPWSTDSSDPPAAHLELAGPGQLTINWSTDEATLKVHRRGGATDLLELGDSLDDVGAGTKLELLPADPQHGKHGDYLFAVTAYKTPPRAAPALAEVTPAATTGPRMLLADIRNPPVSGAAAAAAAVAAGGSSPAAKSTGQAKRAAGEAEAAQHAAPHSGDPAAPGSAKRQKVAGDAGEPAAGEEAAAEPPAAAAAVAAAASDADMVDAQEQQDPSAQQAAQAHQAFAETQALDAYSSDEEMEGGDGAPAVAGGAPEPAQPLAAAREAAEASEGAGEGHEQPRAVPFFLPPTQAVGPFDEEEEEEEAEGEEGVDVCSRDDAAREEHPAAAEQPQERCRELLQETRAVLLDKEGGGSSLATAQRSAAWATDLNDMAARARLPPVVIGVVGDTGAGKSSMLNALLEEEEVLPQNGMRACTACVVEVSYVSHAHYQAEIEFMTEGEWMEQVERPWGDLLGEDGLPQLARGDRPPDSRSMHGAAQAVLDATRPPGTWAARCPKNRRDEVATWALVKVCRIAHNWPLLASGAQLVDLPGVRDANAARGAVAEAYLKRCNAIWIAADITRAVDNKTAKDLLGDSFRRQMMLDGQFNAISFVATKADNIMPREVIDSLGVQDICHLTGTSLESFTQLEEQIEERRDEEGDLERGYQRGLRAHKKALKQQGECEARLSVIREQIEERGGNFGLDDDLPGGGAGSSAGGCVAGGSRAAEEAGDEEVSLNTARQEGHREGRTRARKKYIQWGEAKLREERRGVLEKQAAAQQAQRDAVATKRQLRSRLDALKRELQGLQTQFNGICARARNAYSKEQLRRDFREGVEAGGVRAATAADLDLPVYCISARDAQKLEHRCRKDGPVLSGFVTSTALLLRDQTELAAEVGAGVQAAFQEHAARLEEELQTELKGWAEQLDALVLGKGLSPRLEAGAARAETVALPTSAKWADWKTGGYRWATYKACVKRGGDYTGGVRGDISFNGDLAGPILDAIAVEWDNTFAQKIGQHLQEFCGLARTALSRALAQLKDTLQGLGLDSHRVERLCTQAAQEEARRLREGVEAILGPVGEKQRDLSRDVIKPTVKEHMDDVYQQCTAEVGPGQFERMKGHMRGHISGKQVVMFTAATDRMEGELEQVVSMLVAEVQAMARRLLDRLAHTFSVLWERPPSNETQRAAAVQALTGIARTAAEVCEAAGAKPSAALPTLLGPHVLQQQPQQQQQQQPQQEQQQAQQAAVAAAAAGAMPMGGVDEAAWLAYQQQQMQDPAMLQQVQQLLQDPGAMQRQVEQLMAQAAAALPLGDYPAPPGGALLMPLPLQMQLLPVPGPGPAEVLQAPWRPPCQLLQQDGDEQQEEGSEKVVADSEGEEAKEAAGSCKESQDASAAGSDEEMEEEESGKEKEEEEVEEEEESEEEEEEEAEMEDAQEELAGTEEGKQEGSADGAEGGERTGSEALSSSEEEEEEQPAGAARGSAAAAASLAATPAGAAATGEDRENPSGRGKDGSGGVAVKPEPGLQPAGEAEVIDLTADSQIEIL